MNARIFVASPEWSIVSRLLLKVGVGSVGGFAAQRHRHDSGLAQRQEPKQLLAIAYISYAVTVSPFSSSNSLFGSAWVFTLSFRDVQHPLLSAVRISRESPYCSSFPDVIGRSEVAH